MATQSGTIDPTAVRVLQEALGLDDISMQEYLNSHSGLLGLSGRSSDLRELLRLEAEGDHRAQLALQTLRICYPKGNWSDDSCIRRH